MKEIVLAPRIIARELFFYAACVIAALAVNAYAILRFHTEWKELWTTFPITLAVALVFFVVLAVVRGIVFGCRRLLRLRMGA